MDHGKTSENEMPLEMRLFAEISPVEWFYLNEYDNGTEILNSYSADISVPPSKSIPVKFDVGEHFYFPPIMAHSGMNLETLRYKCTNKSYYVMFKKIQIKIDLHHIEKGVSSGTMVTELLKKRPNGLKIITTLHL